MLLARLFLRTRSLHLAAGVLVVLLQRTPVLRALVGAETRLIAPAGNLLRAALAPLAALGAVHTLAGATTQLVANVALPARATVGQNFSMAVAITGNGVSFAQSWDVTNSLPPGVTPVGGAFSGGQFVVNPSAGTLTFSGTPTAAGTYTFTARGYQFTNRTGPVTTGTASITVAAAPNSAPAITRQPAAQSLSAGGTITLTVAYTGVPAPTFQWFRNSTALPGANSPTLTIDRATAADAGAYTVTITNAVGTVTSAAAQINVNAAPAAPTFAAAPLPQTATAGGAAIFTVEVQGVPVPSLQWLRNGSGLAGETSATLILNNVSAAHAGLYAVTASNASGNTTSPAARLTVTPATAPPAFAAQPSPVTASLGSTVVLSATVTGIPAPDLQWRKTTATGTADIPGATSPTLVLEKTTAADAASYTLVARNTSAVDPVASTPAPLALIDTKNPGRLINLSVITALAPGETMAMGTVLGGAGTSGDKALLARAAGPSLAAFGVGTPLPDPKMSLLGAGGVVVATNDNWAGAPALANAFTQVGAFAYATAASKDAAVFQPALPAGNYTVSVADTATTATGSVIAELYDATPLAAVTPATPRLINVSVLKRIATGGSLTAGFVIAGDTAKTVLIRAIGPGLTAFGVGDPMADPRLTLFNGNTKLSDNDNWGGDPALTNASKAVGAFGIVSTDSRDAMLLLTLPPGSYGAQVAPSAEASLTTGGTALVEVYEVP
ncbi:MAG: hypothetical protein RLZZ15_2052 [Verrucomicrobiota bacterium]